MRTPGVWMTYKATRFPAATALLTRVATVDVAEVSFSYSAPDAEVHSAKDVGEKRFVHTRHIGQVCTYQNGLSEYNPSLDMLNYDEYLINLLRERDVERERIPAASLQCRVHVLV